MVRNLFFACLVGLPIGIVAIAQITPWAWWAFVLVGPILLVGIRDVTQRSHSLLRIYPIIGHGRYLFEAIRPEIQQYFVESNIDGTPYNREFRSLIYQRAKGDRDTVPFGTQRNLIQVGAEWLAHSMAPKEMPAEVPRVHIGPKAKQPYDSSYLNISAMSYGSLSKNAVMALNWGAKDGGFAHNTGEGSISPYHLEYGGDLIWQIGTGYFGCRTDDGEFCPDRFKERAAIESVKMIEIKISQGAKPGHGGILPGAKVTPEIAEIRGVPVGKTVYSPPYHRAFSTPKELLEFVEKLRDLSGKPVGFKLCVGKRSEFLGICKAMLETGQHPDFITVDGAEGGTGAAPVELSNSVGMPMRDGLLFVHNALTGVGFRDKLKLVASGKITSGFHLVRAIALGADLCASARAMMFALGCIQARRCNANDCPVGVATQEPGRNQGLVVEKKAPRVEKYHRATVHSFLDLIGSAGLDSPRQITPRSITRRMSVKETKTYAEIYRYLKSGELLSDPPEEWRPYWEEASADTFYTFLEPVDSRQSA